MTDINITFSRTLLSAVMADVKELTTTEQRKAAWVYHLYGQDWEFHGPNGFYWNGHADNAYDARAQGWSRWLEKQNARAA